ncbi:MAG: hydrogenase maturation protease [Anaerolineae bacterium]
MIRILVAGMGNVLRRDDGFGVEVAHRLAADPKLPSGVKVMEVGIGGIHVVQELMAAPYDALIILDAVQRGSRPGSIHLLAVDVPDIGEWPRADREHFLADTHYATPSKVLILSKALGVLPPRAYILGCQPANAESLGIGLSHPVEQAAEQALRELERLFTRESLPDRR